MKERNLDFDMVVERRGSDSLKFDFAKERGLPADVLPFWVADMDFRISGFIQDALIRQVQHGIYGYTETRENYKAVIAKWMKRRNDWDIRDYQLVKTPGVVPAIGAAVEAFTEKGDAVLIQQPVYYCFSEVIRLCNRRVVSSDLLLTVDAEEKLRYVIDFEDFERKIVEEKVKLFLLCNPHNPGGRVWTRKELEHLAEICYRHHVIVVSDEIHSDLIFPGHKHTVFATVSPEAEEITVTCTSPGKTFNISGLQIGNVLIKNRRLWLDFKRTLNGSCGYSQANAAGIAACEAAYKYGEEWYKGVLSYIHENLEYLKDYLKKYLPMLGLMEPEATFLVFLDFRKLHLSTGEEKDLIVNKAKLWLDSGEVFGEPGRGFERINIACPRSVLTEALERLRSALADWAA